MMQAFEWDSPADGGYYAFLKENAKKIKDAGIDALWLPPMCKGGGDQDVGYGIYDLWDLGEFDQKAQSEQNMERKKNFLRLLMNFTKII